MRYKNSFLAGFFVILFLIGFSGARQASAYGEGVTFSGVVRNADGISLSGLVVQLVDANGRVFNSVGETGSDGAFSLIAPIGDYELDVVTSDGNALLPYFSMIKMSGFALPAETTLDLTIPAQSVDVTAIDPADGRPVQGQFDIYKQDGDPDSFALYQGGPEAFVDGWGWEKNDTTDANGVAHLLFLPTHGVTVHFLPTPGGVAHGLFTRDFLSSAPQSFTLDAVHEFSGVIKDGDGNPVVDATVALTNHAGPPETYWSAATGGDGSFSLLAPNDDDYLLTVYNMDHIPTLPFTGSVQMDGFAMNGDTAQDLTLPYRATVFSIFEASGAPLAATVTVNGSQYATAAFTLYPNGPSATIDGSGWSVSAASDGATGEAVIRYFPTRGADVSVVPLGATPGASHFTRDVVDPSPQTVSLGASAVLSGIVKDSAGHPQSGITVKLDENLDGLVYASTVTADDGAYAVTAPVGNYTIHLYTGDMSDDGNNVLNQLLDHLQLPASMIEDLIVPTRTATISVVDPSGQPVAGAPVYIEAKACDFDISAFSFLPVSGMGMAGDGWSRHVTTDGTGTATVSFVPGCYEVEASPIDDNSVKTEVEGRSDSDMAITVALGHAYVYGGTATTSQGLPLPGLVATLTDAENNVYASAPSAADGTYSVRVPTGLYNVRLSLAQAVPSVAPAFGVTYLNRTISGDTTQDLVLQTRLSKLFVTDPSDQPVSGANATLSNGWGYVDFFGDGSGSGFWIGSQSWSASGMTDETGVVNLISISDNNAALEIAPPDGLAGLTMRLGTSVDVERTIQLQAN